MSTYSKAHRSDSSWKSFFACPLLAVVLTDPAHADVSEYISARAWNAAVGDSYLTIDFTGHPEGGFIGDTYASQGLHFLTGFFAQSPTLYPNDSWGAFEFAVIITFDTPQQWIAIEHYGPARLVLYNNNQQVYVSSISYFPGPGNFSGLVSTTPFDRVQIYQPSPDQSHLYIDDLHWGAPVPAPGVVGVFTLLGLLPRRRRS